MKKETKRKKGSTPIVDKAKQTAAEIEAALKNNQVKPPSDVEIFKSIPLVRSDPQPLKTPEEIAKSIPKAPALVEEVIRDRYEFTDAEKLALGSGLAQGHSQIAALKQEAKSIAADYKAKVEAISGGVNSATEKINSGFEMRAIECVVLHQRKVDKGQLPFKVYYRKDTGAFVRREPMTASDFALLNCDWPAGHKVEQPYFPPKVGEKK